MRILHISDHHGRYKQLSKHVMEGIDLVVATGDMLPNYPQLIFFNMYSDPPSDIIWDPLSGKPQPKGLLRDRIIDPDREFLLQNKFIKELNDAGGFRNKYLQAYQGPVVCVRGNHDFTDLKPLFGGECYEITWPDQSYEIDGFKIGGCRGIPYIAGEWADEIKLQDWPPIVKQIPTDLDILVTHTPPLGILSKEWGCAELMRYINNRFYDDEKTKLRACLFGHTHECFGSVNHNGTVFSNAATGFRVIEIEKKLTDDK